MNRPYIVHWRSRTMYGFEAFSTREGANRFAKFKAQQGYAAEVEHKTEPLL